MRRASGQTLLLMALMLIVLTGMVLATLHLSARTKSRMEMQTLAGMDTGYGRTRGSGVLRRTEDGWKIEQYVLSFAVPNDRASAVVQAIKSD